ncbi:hypothetical protein [Saccharothrix deserti]|uniref:hypothetical protein n=1 Tax=Saccharothrix deserti TaxID=2593674 RepID=UPI00131C8E70|nr:hypothetical protein [Saccharothrix deserti]
MSDERWQSTAWTVRDGLVVEALHLWSFTGLPSALEGHDAATPSGHAYRPSAHATDVGSADVGVGRGWRRSVL